MQINAPQTLVEIVIFSIFCAKKLKKRKKRSKFGVKLTKKIDFFSQHPNAGWVFYSPKKVNSNLIELTVNTSCYSVLDLLCVTLLHPWNLFQTDFVLSCFIKFDIYFKKTFKFGINQSIGRLWHFVLLYRGWEDRRFFSGMKFHEVK